MLNSAPGMPITVVTSRMSEDEDRRAIRLINFMGANVSQRMVDLEYSADRFQEEFPPQYPTALIISADTLIEILNSASNIKAAFEKLISGIPQIFVYGWRPYERHVEVLRELTDRHLSGMTPVLASPSMTFDGRDIGMTAGLINLKLAGKIGLPSSGFELSRGEQKADTIIGIGEHAILVRLSIAGSEIYLCSEARFANPDAPLGAWPTLSSCLSGILPLLLFVRKVAGGDCWLPVQSFACVTIDDPPLRKEYGYLNYKDLLDGIRRFPMHASCGVIPWDYRRSQPDVTRLFAENPEKLSIAYHGCDHIKGEFSRQAPGFLAHQVATARERMEVHRSVTGLHCDDVMIFPQHSYSPNAIPILLNGGFLAATTGNINPVNSEHPLTLGDLMNPAVSGFCDWPIFSRTYANQESEILLYSILGKPIIICVHHDAFRCGYEWLEEFGMIVGRISPSVEWVGLEKMATGCCLARKSASSDGPEIRFFARRFRFGNELESRKCFRFTKRESSPDTIVKVTCASRECSWKWSEGVLIIEKELERCATIELDVFYTPTEENTLRPNGFVYEFGVWTRRRLSVIRDQYVSRFRNV
jgi:hypothetical protein